MSVAVISIANRYRKVFHKLLLNDIREYGQCPYVFSLRAREASFLHVLNVVPVHYRESPRDRLLRLRRSPWSTVAGVRSGFP